MIDEFNAKSLADSYQLMMKLPAWKDLEAYAESEQLASVLRSDSKAASDLNINFICEERGIRKGIKKIMLHAIQRTEGI